MTREFGFYGPVLTDEAEKYFKDRFTYSVDEALTTEPHGTDYWAEDAGAVLKLLLATGLICSARLQLQPKLPLLTVEALESVLIHVRAASCQEVGVLGRWCRFLDGGRGAAKNPRKKGRGRRPPKP